MKKALVMIVLVLFLAGCGGIPGRSREPQTGYKTGSQGLVINFLPNYPRPRIYDDEPFNVIVEVRNKGAHEVGFAGDKIYLSGYDTGIITGISTSGQQLRQTEGITQYNSEGGYDTIEFNGQVNPLRTKNIDHYPATILATACYGYKTIASNNICIDPNPYSTSQERKVCTPTTVSYGSQGAPIAVSSVEVEPTPRMTRFKITISNVGGGTVFKWGPDFLMKCSPYHTRGLEYNEIDYVRLTGVEVAGRSIAPSCKPVDNGVVKLIGGIATLFCELGGIGTGPAYTTPLTVTLDYGYRTTISRSVDIVQIP